MKYTYINGATIVNESATFVGSVLIADNEIVAVVREGEAIEVPASAEVIDASGKWLLPGIIDDQVHFREPGLTHKATIATESAAAVAGGVTSYMEMPNTIPQTTTIEALAWKFDRAAETSYANYSFFLGATNDNIDELRKIDTTRVCGVKAFMGSSTGNMLVDSPSALEKLFAEVPTLIAVHCEKEAVIAANKQRYINQFGEDLPVLFHPLIRNAEACYASSAQAAELATRYGSRLHLLHLSTAREMSLLSSAPLAEKRITGEVCAHHLYFDDNDYATYGNLIKWNPAIKTTADRLALTQGLIDGKIDVVATDHAPHLLAEKQGSCLKAASGGPLLQHSLLIMLEKVAKGVFSLELVVEKMCHAPAELFHIEKRGYIRKGYYADLVLVDPNKRFTVIPDTLFSNCGWSPLMGHTFGATIDTTFVNGVIAYRNGELNAACRGSELRFI